MFQTRESCLKITFFCRISLLEARIIFTFIITLYYIVIKYMKLTFKSTQCETMYKTMKEVGGIFQWPVKTQARVNKAAS